MMCVDSAGWRVAFMSAACNAGASCFILASVQRYLLLSSKLSGQDGAPWEGSLWAGFFAGGMYALNPLVWLYSLQVDTPRRPLPFRISLRRSNGY